MSADFSKELRGYQFEFQPLEIANKVGYSGNVKDKDGNRWEFRLFAQGDSHNYKLEGENLPDWLLAMEVEINQAVNAHE